MLPIERLAFSEITSRPPLPLPGGARMVVWIAVNVENWDPTQPMPRTVNTPPGGQKVVPDIPNWCWHEYGHRVGFSRIKRILEDFAITPTLAINASVCEHYPTIARQALDAGWEFMGHGYVQKSMPALEDQRSAIRQTFETIRKFTGKAPRGWLSPGLAETYETVDYLQEEGFEYVADWVLDDQPCILKTKNGSIVSIPYTQEINDVPLILGQQHPGREYAERAIDQFEQLFDDAATATRVMCISVHPYIMGVPHRARHFRRLFEHMRHRSGVLFWTGEQILNWYAGLQRAKRPE